MDFEREPGRLLLALPQGGCLALGRFDCPSLFLFYFFLLGPHSRHMEVPRLGVETKLPLPA